MQKFTDILQSLFLRLLLKNLVHVTYFPLRTTFYNHKCIHPKPIASCLNLETSSAIVFIVQWQHYPLHHPIMVHATRCCAPIHYGGYELTFPLQNGSFIWSTLMAAAAVKTGEPIHRRGASYCDSQPPNCSFEVITRQVRAISSTMPETNGGGRARLMRSESRGRPPAECQGPLRGHLP